jgi:hypothetical protein
MNAVGFVTLGENEKMYTVHEVAAIFSISCDSVRRMIGRGIMKAWRLPGIFGCFTSLIPSGV